MVKSEPKTSFKFWESAKDLLAFSTWLPEVVGPPEQIVRLGITAVTQYPDGTIHRTSKVRVNLPERYKPKESPTASLMSKLFPAHR